jgi:lysyl-tRNA synthetase, class II
MATIDEIKEGRLKKLKAIESAGFLAYPGETKRTHNSKEVLNEFTKLGKSKKEIFLTGRLMSTRQHGGLIFCHIEDGEGQVQIMLKKDGLGEKNFQFFLDNFDIGDFIQVRGILFQTKRGEKTLELSDYKMLVKTLLPLPEKWHGIQDVEERFRKRYLDLIFNKEVKEKFILRSNIVKEVRSFLNSEGFLEVETAMLQPIYGGATAKPFKTHLNALDMDLYLRIAPELYLKRLLVGGFEKVYEIGKCFRNEGVDKAHNPDFTMLEFYWAYADYKDLMKFTEKMVSHLLKKLFKSSKILYQGKELDFKTPWQRVEYAEIFKKHTGIDLEEINTESLRAEAEKLGLKDIKGAKFEIADEIFKKAIRPKIDQPTFVINYPAEAFPLAKPIDKNPEKSASFQLVVAGMELIKAFSELNNPILQEERFKGQEKIFKEGFEEAQRMDADFIEALKYGMPPAAGFGMGIDRLAMLLTDSHSARDIILFPTMRNK